MAEIIFVIVGITAGTGLLISSIITTYCCYKRYRRNQLTSNIQPSKQQHEEDYLHSVIINQHIAKHLRPNSTISFISDNYHNDMTLIAPPRRLAMLEQQQQQQQHEPAMLVIENPLVSLSINPIEEKSARLQTFVYENPSLELGELPTTSAIQF
jgi:hypothetical protein